MSRIRLFESRDVPEWERLSGLRPETISPLARSGRWRREAPHAEPGPVLIWIARGQGRVTMEAQTRGYGPTTCVSIPAGTPFSITPGAMTEGTLLHLPDLFEAPLPPEPRRFRITEAGAQAELTGLLENLTRPGELRDPPVGRAALARVILLSALVEREARGIPVDPPNAPARLAARFAYEVEKTLGTGANLTDIGETLGVTPTHLTRTLRDTCDMTAANYLNGRLMHEARRRLADTDQPAAEIAAELGFSSAAYFSRAFGRAAGQTPSAFRRSERRRRS